jgi:hypothetical protein
MKSSTELTIAERRQLEAWQEPEWQDLDGMFSQDIDHIARVTGALVRGRNLKEAAVLLRLILAYAVCDWSLRLVGAWATLQGLAFLSDVALLYRFRQSTRFVGLLVMRLLQRRNSALSALAGVRIRLVDGTVISEPGSRGTDWRLHASVDLGTMCLDGVAISDAHTGESLAHFPVRNDEIYVADRGHAFGQGMGALLRKGARLVVRTNWHNPPIKTEDGQPVRILPWLKSLTRTQERSVILNTPQGSFPIRLIARPLPPAEAQKARERVAKQARKKGRPVSPDTYLAAGFVLLLSNLPVHTWEASRVAWLYRIRWQIELHFKRLKSLLHFDQLRAHDPRLVQTYLLGKLLAALLLDELIQQTQAQTPQWFASTTRPVSLWRLSALLWAGIRAWIIGHLSIPRILAAMPHLKRYLCDPPRARSQQLAWARHVLLRLSPDLPLFRG